MTSYSEQDAINSGMVFVMVDGPLGHEPAVIQVIDKSDGAVRRYWCMSTTRTRVYVPALCDNAGGFRDGYRIVGVMTPTPERREGHRALLKMMTKTRVISEQELEKAKANCRE
jgi:hypothetical protein